MSCTEGLARPLGVIVGLLMSSWILTGCNHVVPPPAAVPIAPSSGSAAAQPVPSGGPAKAPGAAMQAANGPRLPPRPARHWDDYRQQAAERIVQANPDGCYLGQVPEPLLAIPVLEVELNADGSVHRIHVMRRPTQALDTVQLAIAAVQRAAPFGPVAHLPRPWKFTEVFLFDEQRRFKPRSLDL